MDIASIWVLVAYLTLVVELCFFALPSEASTLQLFFPGSVGARSPRQDSLRRAQERRPLAKLLLYLLPTGLGVVLFLVPPAAVLWPPILEHLLPLPALDRPAVVALGLVAITFGRLLTFLSVLQLRRMQSSPSLGPRGLFRFSRNPGLCGMFAFYLGNACVFPCGVLFVGFLPYVLNMHRRVLMEESHLTRTLGESYHAYLARVPRYLLGGKIR